MSICHKCRIVDSQSTLWNKIAQQWLCVDCNDLYFDKLDEFNGQFFQGCEEM